MLLLVLGVILLTLTFLANYGPLRSYFDARARLGTVNAAIAELAGQNAELQTELDRLSDADYIESLARQDLAYTRPGEELYIVMNAQGGTTSTPGDTTSSAVNMLSGGPGFMERVLGQLLDP